MFPYGPKLKKKKKSPKLCNSHLTSGSEPEGLLWVEERSPKSVLLRTEEGFISPVLDIYNKSLHLDVWCWTLLNGTERNGHFQVEIHLILLWMWKTVEWHLYSTHDFFGHLNLKLGDLTEVPDLLCHYRFPFASKWGNVVLELSFPECKHGMGCLLLGYHYFFLSPVLQSALPVALALPFITLLKLKHKPDMNRNATRYHVTLTGYTTGSAWLLLLHHRSHQTLYGLPAQTGPDRLWLLWCAPSWFESSLILFKHVKPLVWLVFRISAQIQRYIHVNGTRTKSYSW